MTYKFNKNSPYWYGMRYNSDQPKAAGYFGEIAVPNTNDKATEYSLDVDIGGKNVQIPSIVPTLNGNELSKLIGVIGSDGRQEIPNQLVMKAIDHAKMRISNGLSPFWAMPEKQTPIPNNNIEFGNDGEFSLNQLSRFFTK